ncbi:hypothetical protein L5L55_05780 [Shewanella glacialipiscicola]|uniref:hypothetical protein n=1 Tax=Shewanella glacialipiscicola TaxID=614069 RepID=UPI0021D8184E|nr:hypothetical protein [Shewanella glacialipiscicola]MCU7994269.1 hypothetical protein [Shewanella glacialipiscicola]MCU8025740.1 hypothetical protein [Shewanella glacialipiscicola]
MLVVSNYPQVPLATTNVATDSARVDNQLKPVVIPPQAATKGHQERAFNPQNERTAEQTQQQTKTLEHNQQQVQEKQQQQHSSQQQSQQQQERKAPLVVAERVLPKMLKMAIRGQAALQRKDIRLKVSQDAASYINNSAKANTIISVTRQFPQDEPNHFYQQLGQRISLFYERQTQPEQEPALSTSI